MSSAERRQGGFSLLELVAAASVFILVMAVVFAAVDPARGLFASQHESADMQQRLRVAAHTLYRELHQAGAGTSVGGGEGPLLYYFAPVLPHHHGRSGDPAGTFRSDAISLAYVPEGRVQAATATPLGARAGTVGLDMGLPCRPGRAACGFLSGMSVVVFDGIGAYSRYTVLAVQPEALDLRHDMPDSATVFPAGSTISALESASYFVTSAPGTAVPQLVRTGSDGTRRVPVVDHVVSLRFAYYGDPRPPMMVRPLSEPVGPWTSYGPRPPLPNSPGGAYPAGENCVFVDAGGTHPSPRLSTLGGATSLVPLSAAHFTDGPWCPDGVSPGRYDADLLRLRAIDVTIRVESALATLRGPAGVLFGRAGRSRGGPGFVPDIDARFRVTPRNLSVEY